MKVPKISIVIPAYNEEKVIAQVITHALAQDYPNFEVIVIDNVSVDKTSEIAKTFPVQVIYEPKKGLPAARECGRRFATGDIVANLDADCLPEKDWLSRAVKIFDRPGVVAVSGPYDYYDGSRGLRCYYRLQQRYFLALTITNILFGRGARGGWITGGNNFIKLDTLRSLGGYDTSIEFWGEDVLMSKMLARVGRVVFDRNLIMKTSARRYMAPGSSPLKLTWIYAKQSLKILFTSKK